VVQVLAQIVRRVLHGVEQWHDFDLERIADNLAWLECARTKSLLLI
jgi:hypothetical protein